MTVPERIGLSATIIRAPLVDKNGMLTAQWQRWFTTVPIVVNNFSPQGSFNGSVGPAATLEVRGIPLATLLQYIDNNGVVTKDGIDFARDYLNQNINYIADGTGSPIAGGKEAYLALVASGPAAGQVLQWNGTAWVPVTLPAGGVAQLIAGSGIVLSPAGGTGVVTVSAGAGSGVPSVLVGAAAGLGGTATLVAGSTDTRGQIQIVTGTGPTTGTLVTVTLSAPLGATFFPQISPANGAAIMDGTTPTQVSAQFVDSQHWTLTVDPNATAANINFMAFNYQVIP